MQLIGLNAQFQNIGFIPYVNLQWIRRYYEPGEFSIQIRADDYNADMVYVITNERPEVGMIQKLRTDDTIKGHFVQLEGYFLEKALDRPVIKPRFKMTGTAPAIVHSAVSANPPDGIALNMLPLAPGGSETEVDWLGQQLGEATFETLKTQEYGQRITLDYLSNVLSYEVWQGLDRTQSQETNSYALFSDESESVAEFRLDEDESGYKNVAVVAHGDENNPSFFDVDIREDASEVRREIFVDYIGSNETQDAMRQDAIERLGEYERIKNAEIKTIQSNLLYLRDYDLGDKCDVVNHRLGRAYESRIISVDEVFKANQHIVTLEFGEKLPTNYEKMSRLARNMRR